MLCHRRDESGEELGDVWVSTFFIYQKIPPVCLSHHDSWLINVHRWIFTLFKWFQHYLPNFRFSPLDAGHEKCTFHHDLELDHRPSTREDAISDMASSYRKLLTSLGENPNRQVNEAEIDFNWNFFAQFTHAPCNSLGPAEDAGEGSQGDAVLHQRLRPKSRRGAQWRCIWWRSRRE